MPDVYVARRRLRVGDHYVMPGDEVPEANSWYHLSTYVHNGSLALVQTETHYARGMHQRRPQAPDRADPHVKRERWHGELGGWGKPGASSEPDPPVITSVTPDPIMVNGPGASGVTNAVVFTGTGFTRCYPIFTAPVGVSGQLASDFPDDPTVATDTSYEIVLSVGMFSNPDMNPVMPCPGTISLVMQDAPYTQVDYPVTCDVAGG